MNFSLVLFNVLLIQQIVLAEEKLFQYDQKLFHSNSTCFLNHLNFSISNSFCNYILNAVHFFVPNSTVAFLINFGILHILRVSCISLISWGYIVFWRS